MEAIRQLVLRIMTKGETGIIKTLPKKDLVDFNTAILAEKLMSNGVDPNAFKNADQVFNVLKQIDEANKAKTSGITETQSAKVFDMEGKEIPKGSKIMGGKAVDDDLPPPGSRGGDDDIAAPVQSSEESLKNMIEAENKKAIDNLKQKMAKEKSRTQRISGNLRADNAQRVEIGQAKLDQDEYDYYKEILGEDPEVDYYPVKGDETKEFLEAMVKEQKDEMAYMKRLYDKGALDDPDKKAEGGRAGYKFGIGPLIELLTKASKTSPLQFGKNYMKNIKEKTLRANETGKFMDLPIAEAGLPAATGALITNQVKKKLKSMNEDERQKNKDEMFAEISQEYKERYKDDPEFLEKMLLSLHENIYMDKKAEGGRVGLKSGSLKKFLERRNFLKTIVGNSPEAENARILQKILDEQKEFKKFLDKNPPVKFPGPGDKEYDDYILRLNQIMAKDRLKSATGGRIGYKVGSFDKARRAFLKMLGLGAGTAAAAKSGILRFSDTAVPKVVEKVPINSSTLSEPPPYFFELAEKIKRLGKPDKVTYQERVEITRYTGKNGDEYELIEDLNTGDMRIQKDKMGVGTYGDKSFDTIEDRTVLEYRKGEYGVKDEGLETQKSFREADEYEEYKVEFDADGTEAGADDLDAIVQKEIIEEAKGDAPSIKKAGGGIARMLGE
jgi:hypothetical protein